VAAAVAAFWPNPRSWQSLGPHLGRIRWVGTRTDPEGQHPLAPKWIRAARKNSIPWPTDLPVEPLGPSFGPGTYAWYLVQSARESNELWNVDKSASQVIDNKGAVVESSVGGSAVLIDSDRRLQFVCVRVPEDLSRTGARLKLRLTRAASLKEQSATQELSVPF
jgi:hypothetical protein